MYAGRGVILQNAEDDSVGFTRQRATAIVESLTFQGMAVL